MVLLREHLHVDHINKHLHLLVNFPKRTKPGKGLHCINKALVTLLALMHLFQNIYHFNQTLTVRYFVILGVHQLLDTNLQQS